MAKKASGSKSTAKTGSATTSRTGQVGAAETTVTAVEDANDKAAAASKREAPAATATASREAPARKGHAVGVPRKTVEAKFGPKNPDIDGTRQRTAAVGGI
jgi:hypothetical protein